MGEWVPWCLKRVCCVYQVLWYPFGSFHKVRAYSIYFYFDGYVIFILFFHIYFGSKTWKLTVVDVNRLETQCTAKIKSDAIRHPCKPIPVVFCHNNREKSRLTTRGLGFQALALPRKDLWLWETASGTKVQHCSTNILDIFTSRIIKKFTFGLKYLLWRIHCWNLSIR